MCRMLGIKNFEYKKHKNIIQKFFLLAENGKVPPNNPKGHLDGWGVGWYDKNKKANVYKSANSVVEEKEIFLNLLKQIEKTKVLIIHFRKSAWKNTNSVFHSHPFKDENSNIVFAHNGTIYEYKKLFKYINQKNTNDYLDSATFFWLLISNLSSKNEIKSAFKKTINIIKKETNFSSLTCIFSEGKNLYLFREYTKLDSYYTLYLAKETNTKIISSEPLDENLSWQLVAPCRLLVC